MKAELLKREMQKLVKVTENLNKHHWLTTKKARSASQVTTASTSVERIPRDKLDRLTEEFMSEHA